MINNDPDVLDTAYMDAMIAHLSEPIPPDLHKLAEAVHSLMQAQIHQIKVNKAIAEKLQYVLLKVPT